MKVRVLVVAAAALAVLLPGPAQAIPAFARKYNVACSTCHEAWPKLNDFGQLFRDNGYRMNRGKDNPTEQPGAYWPIAMRTTVGYQYAEQEGVPVDQPPGTTTTKNGTFGFAGLDILTAGALGEQFSWLVVYTPGLGSAGFGTGPSDGDLESAFVGYHRIFGTPFLNVRVGKHAPDLPVDEHRILTLTQGYNVYHFHPQGSAATFEPGSNQAGVEIYGHSELDALRYSVSVMTENDAIFSKNWVSSPVVWGRLSGKVLLNNGILPEVKGGVFGSAGWHPVQALTQTDPATGEPVPVSGAAYSNQPYQKYGADLHLLFFSNVNPLDITGVIMFGNEDQALITDGVRSAQWIGGFVEINWVPTFNWAIIGRWERIRTTQAGSDTLPQNEGDLTALTLGVRYTVEFSNRMAATVLLEGSQVTTTVSGTKPKGSTVLAGIDFAF
ncbi:MAG TPA: hypothetical protein VLT82_09745 [Myxococcaceae bacterium]|nr:hypothetical protein [Myxococcaceae bacterium]